MPDVLSRATMPKHSSWGVNAPQKEISTQNTRCSGGCWVMIGQSFSMLPANAIPDDPKLGTENEDDADDLRALRDSLNSPGADIDFETVRKELDF